MRFYVFQQEVCPETGRSHYQGYIQFTKALRKGGVLNVFRPFPPHVVPARGSPQENLAYCTKEPRTGGPWQHGEMQFQGNRKLDTVAAVQLFFKEASTGGLTWQAAQLDSRFIPLIIRNTPFCQQLYEQARQSALPPEVPPPLGWRMWQAELLRLIEGPISDRAVHWVYDENGGVGKSTLARFLVTNGLAFCSPTAASVRDVLHVWSMHCHEPTRAVVFDLMRHTGDRYVYDLVEMFSACFATSTKYNGGVIRWQRRHLIVFANILPLRPQASIGLSADRLEGSTYEVSARAKTHSGVEWAAHTLAPINFHVRARDRVSADAQL